MWFQHEQLLEVAVLIGLDEAETRVVLESGKYREEIVETVEQMHKMGINSIPVLIFDVQSSGADGDFTLELMDFLFNGLI